MKFKDHIAKTASYKGGATRPKIKEGEKTDTIYKLSSNENLLGPSPKAIQAIVNSFDSLSEYQHQTDIELKMALVDHFDNGIKANQYFTANSGMEIIDIICRGFLKSNSEIIISSPTFKAYKNFAALENARTIDIPLLKPDFGLDVDGILNAITDQTRLIFLTNPNNPTGTFIPKEKVDYLLDNISDDIIIVYDEVYYHFVENDTFCNAAHYINNNKNVIAIHSFSKAYGLAGIRVGYAFSTPEISEYLQKISRPFMINALSTVAAIAALSDNEHIENTKNLIRTEKNYMYEQFDLLKIKYWRSETNFILFKSPIAESDITKAFLDNNIMVRPCSKFGAPDHIRVTIGTHKINVLFFKVLQILLS
ncbi:histidinol-phosphate transaminase [Zobellia sp.]|nr:histidinol-phosphate transaminase [Zobellia sp.]